MKILVRTCSHFAEEHCSKEGRAEIVGVDGRHVVKVRYTYPGIKCGPAFLAGTSD